MTQPNARDGPSISPSIDIVLKSDSLSIYNRAAETYYKDHNKEDFTTYIDRRGMKGGQVQGG